MAKTVFVDTGVPVALLSARDQFHAWAVEQAKSMPLPWMTSEAVLSETWHRIAASPKARSGLLAMLRRGVFGFPMTIPGLLGDLCQVLEKVDELTAHRSTRHLLLTLSFEKSLRGIMVILMQTITFKVNDEEARLIRSLARREKTSLSEYLRRKATGIPAGQDQPQRILCPHTGAMVFSGMPGHQPLTTESVRQMLADFP